MNDNTLYSEKESFNQQGYSDFYLKPNVINIGFRLFIALLAGSIPGFILIATLKLELFYLLPIDAICGGILIYWMLSSEHYFVVTEGKLLKLRMIDDKVIDELKMNEIKYFLNKSVDPLYFLLAYLRKSHFLHILNILFYQLQPAMEF